MTLLAMLGAGLAPALQVTSPQLVSSLHEAHRTMSGGRRVSRLRTLLLVAQVAVSVLLLVGAPLFLRGLTRLASVDLGFDGNRVARLSIDLAMQDYAPERPQSFVAEALARVRELPGVAAADVASRVPVSFSRTNITLVPEGHEFLPDQRPAFGFSRIGPEYFRVMGIPLLMGREFTTRDGLDGPRLAIVNDQFARRYWPDTGALGKRLYQQNGDAIEIVGIVKSSTYDTLMETARALIPLLFARIFARPPLFATGPPSSLDAAAGARRRYFAVRRLQLLTGEVGLAGIEWRTL